MTTISGLIASVVTDIQNTRYSELSSSAIIVYDHLITFDQEVEHVWNAPWTIGKTLFLINRYYTLFVVTFNNYGNYLARKRSTIRSLFANFSRTIQSKTNELLVRLTFLWHFSRLIKSSCSQFFHWQGWTGLIACALGEITLQLRLYALYYGNKRILALMLCSFLAVMASSAVIMGTALHETKIESNIIPGIPFCIPIQTSNHFYAFWIPILSFETLLCSLALYKGYRSYKDQELKLRLRRRKAQRLGDASNQDVKGATLLEILLRDSVAYYIVMFATYLTTTMIWIFRPTSDLEIPIGFTVAMSCVMCNRLLLNLRGSKHGQLRRNASGTGNGHGGGTSKSQAHLTSAGDRVDVPTEEIIEVDLGEYELHKLRTLKPTRSRSVNVV
ncbi:hypothetical protein SCHPADRAFT_400011 [Schizopora paradoxa]|uniref:DUF6533 domain-containing protein n=1 Tax=Schizopora paradoxa TaxID=27342 RepID=A0A0H2RMD2_9AGAM|nr:hypothetical protein SCHPADRAFT_400011 [Schizopora paradoxa]